MGFSARAKRLDSYSVSADLVSNRKSHYTVMVFLLFSTLFAFLVQLARLGTPFRTPLSNFWPPITPCLLQCVYLRCSG